MRERAAEAAHRLGRSYLLLRTMRRIPGTRNTIFMHKM
jgi:hypothetical protein